MVHLALCVVVVCVCCVSQTSFSFCTLDIVLSYTKMNPSVLQLVNEFACVENRYFQNFIELFGSLFTNYFTYRHSHMIDEYDHITCCMNMANLFSFMGCINQYTYKTFINTKVSLTGYYPIQKIVRLRLHFKLFFFLAGVKLLKYVSIRCVYVCL